MDFLNNNLNILSKRFPKLTEDLYRYVVFENIAVAQSADGGICYAVKNSEGGWSPITDHLEPIKKAQLALESMQHRIGSSLAPAVIVGLYPGYILETVYRHFESRLKFYEYFRHIYVIIDSPACLAGWLKAADRSDILSREEVLFFSVREVNEIVKLCENEVQRSHLFIPVSVLSENDLNRMIQPLSQLYVSRFEEAEKWKKENNEYYNLLNDNVLARLISGDGGRKPRLLLPTHLTSTVVQFSARDTCKIFEMMGWETRVLKMERDLPPWLMIKEIREFKPDVFLFINHLRTEDDNVDMYPDNMMFITWIQDAMPSINNFAAAEKWNTNAVKRNRDLLTGYTDQLRQYGYLTGRLTSTGMIVNADIFRPVELTEAEKEKYSCDICFTSNNSRTSEKAIEEELFPSLRKYGFSMETLLMVNDNLWREYRAGKTFPDYQILQEFLVGEESFKEVFSSLKPEDRDFVTQKIFWILNDLIYRQVILEWCDELGLKINLYGRDWESHPLFSKYAKGEIEHGEELNKAYNAATYGLHLNIKEGQHQRLMEIIASGGLPLVRQTANAVVPNDFERKGLREIVKNYILLQTAGEQAEFEVPAGQEASAFIVDFITKHGDIHLRWLLKEYIVNIIIYLLDDGIYFSFSSKEEFVKLLSQPVPEKNIDKTNRNVAMNNIMLVEQIYTSLYTLLEEDNERDKLLEQAIVETLDFPDFFRWLRILHVKENISFDAGYFDEVDALLTEGISKVKLNAHFQLLTAASFVRLGKIEKAGEVIGKIKIAELDSPSLRARYIMVSDSAHCFQNSRKYIDDFMVKDKDENPLLYFAAFQNAMASWDFDRAREIVEMNSKAQTSLYGVDHLVQGIVLEYALGRFDEVFSLVEKFNAGIENPLDWWGNLLAFGYFQSALCYRGLGQFDDSLDFFTKIYPDSKNILFSEQKSFFEYARILNYSGDTEAALKVLDQAVVKFPGMNNYCYPLRDVILHTQNKSEISSELVGSWLECARGIGDPMLNYDVFIYIWGAAVKWKNGYQKEAVEILVGNVYNNHSLFPAQREELENIANSGKLFNDEWIKCFFQALYPFWLEGTGEEKLITFELNQILDL